MDALRFRVLILAGPTACGKTALSLRLAQKFPIEIINADMGQFYAPCNIGTAKPDWRNQSVKHHLFDMVDTPKDISVVAYRNKVIQVVREIEGRGNIPLLVGGSFFYLSSLFFPPHEKSASSSDPEPVKKQYENVTAAELWEELNTVDPVRAAALHQNDRYRIVRALTLWHTSHVLPSSQTPSYQPPFSALFLVLTPPRDELYEKIDKRTHEMFDTPHGWIQEAQHLYGTEWETFLRQKKLIGYPEIFDWIVAGARQEELEKLIASIQQATRKYAKRQITFWRRLRIMLENEAKKNARECTVIEIDTVTDTVFEQLIRSINNFVFTSKETNE